MPAPIWEDLELFLQDDEFAAPAVITLQGGGTISLSVLFDDPYVGADAGEYTHDTTDPKATCIASLVGAVQRGDSILINFPAQLGGPKTFDILTSPQGDGTGMAVLELAP